MSEIESIASLEANASLELFSNLQKAIDISIALGATVPAFINTGFYEVKCLGFEGPKGSLGAGLGFGAIFKGVSLGHYQDVESCFRAIVNFLIPYWIKGESWNGYGVKISLVPWSEEAHLLSNSTIKRKMSEIRASEDPLKSYLEAYSPEEIVEAFFGRVNDSYEINYHTVLPTPELLPDATI